jgi:hypothetical protein
MLQVQEMVVLRVAALAVKAGALLAELLLLLLVVVVVG